MSSPVEQKAELQPVHRIFLGELFVFVFFFAGAMSVLVGPMGVAVPIAAITIGSSVAVSALCFLWLAFTTPMRKAEPRYEFLVLSLLPGLLICAGGLGFLELTKPKQAELVMIPIFTKSVSNPTLQSALGLEPLKVFPEELTALDEEMRAMGLTSYYADHSTHRYLLSFPHRMIVQAWSLKYSNDHFELNIHLLNRDNFFPEPSFESAHEMWVQQFERELEGRLTKNMDARKKANAVE